MAPKSNFLKVITLIAFIWLLVIVLMNVFNSGHSYYYAKVLQRIQQQELPAKQLPDPGLTTNNKESSVPKSDDMSHLMVEYANKGKFWETLIFFLLLVLLNIKYNNKTNLNYNTGNASSFTTGLIFMSIFLFCLHFVMY